MNCYLSDTQPLFLRTRYLLFALSICFFAGSFLNVAQAQLVYQTDFSGTAGTEPEDWQLRTSNPNATLSLDGAGHLSFVRSTGSTATGYAYWVGSSGSVQDGVITDGVIETVIEWSPESNGQRIGLLARVQNPDSLTPSAYFAGLYRSGSTNYFVVGKDPVSASFAEIFDEQSVNLTVGTSYTVRFSLIGGLLDVDLLDATGTNLITSLSAEDFSYQSGVSGLHARTVSEGRVFLYDSYAVNIPEPMHAVLGMAVLMTLIYIYRRRKGRYCGGGSILIPSGLAVMLVALPLGAETREAAWNRTGEISWRMSDREKLVKHAGLEQTETGETLLLELNGAVFDPEGAMVVRLIPEQRDYRIRIYDADEKEMPVNVDHGGSYVEIRAGEHEYQSFDGSLVRITPHQLPRIRKVVVESTDRIEQVAFSYTPFVLKERVNLAPRIAEPRNRPLSRSPEIHWGEEGFTLSNSTQQMRFSVNRGLDLVEYVSVFSGKDILGESGESHIFLIELDGRRVAAREWEITEVIAEGNHAVRVLMAYEGLQAEFRAVVEERNIRLGLIIQNISEEPKEWKTVFPQIGGVILSEQAEEDYYLFPLYGGVIHSADAHLQSLYSVGSAWWQMVNVYSPDEGFGLVMRCLDTQGLPKGITFRKGRHQQDFMKLLVGKSQRGIAADYWWEDSLSGGIGSAMAIEYPKSEQAAGASRVYPESILYVHEGDWKVPMQEYADWARETWGWRPMSKKLENTWNQQMITMLSPGYQNQKPLYQEGVWYGDYQQDRIDMGEFGYWWKWSDKGPFGSSLQNAREEVGEMIYNRFRSFFNQKDPISGQPVYKVNDGDYDYNPSTGGLEGLRKGIAAAHDAGAIVQFYTTPFLADDNTRLGKEYGKKFNVMNPYIGERPESSLPAAPRGQHFISYGKWRMCLDIEEYQQMVAENRTRIAVDTGVDCIRLDVLGTGGYPCFNPNHQHMIAESADDLSTMRASRVLVERIRKMARENGRDDLLIAAEYPGVDFLLLALDSSLGYELNNWSPAALRPLPVNLLRFYFPEFKYFDLLHPARESEMFPHLLFWNAVGVRGKQYPEDLYQVLHENHDAFDSRSVEPLVPTLVEELYANRFTAEDKEVILFFNHTGDKVDGPVMTTNPTTDDRYFNLLEWEPVQIVEDRIILEIEPGETAAVARIPETITVSLSGEKLHIGLQRAVDHAELAVYDGKRNVVSRVGINAEGITLGAGEWESGGTLKLFSGSRMVDVRLLDL